MYTLVCDEMSIVVPALRCWSHCLFHTYSAVVRAQLTSEAVSLHYLQYVIWHVQGWRAPKASHCRLTVRLKGTIAMGTTSAKQTARATYCLARLDVELVMQFFALPLILSLICILTMWRTTQHMSIGRDASTTRCGVRKAGMEHDPLASRYDCNSQQHVPRFTPWEHLATSHHQRN